MCGLEFGSLLNINNKNWNRETDDILRLRDISMTVWDINMTEAMMEAVCCSTTYE